VPAPLCPELRVFHATSLVGIWEAAEREAGAVLPSPFWAYPWPAGAALARLLLDQPHRVAGRRVLDFGSGGGIASLAAARAGAEEVVANDIDPWALAVARQAALAQDLRVTLLHADLTLDAAATGGFDVILCADLGYERSFAAAQRAVLDGARRNGAHVLVADAGRAYFRTHGLELLETFELDVPDDLEGVPRRTAKVYELAG
jgi:predicted nicotinamide N-methyase